MYTCTHARHETLYQLFSVALPITHLFGITLLSWEWDKKLATRQPTKLLEVTMEGRGTLLLPGKH